MLFDISNIFKRELIRNIELYHNLLFKLEYRSVIQKNKKDYIFLKKNLKTKITIIMSRMQDKKIAPIEISIWNIPSVSYGDRVYRVINSKAVKLGDDYIITDVDSEDKEDYLDIVEEIMWDELRIQGVSDIEHIKVLSSMGFLKELSLTDGKISDISGLAGLFNLVNLNLSNNEIQDIGDLSGLLSLKELYLDNNNIREIDGKMLPYSLEVLSTKGNPNLNLKNFSKLWRLSKLIR